MDKISKLRQFIEKRPRDPFPRYGLAMEYKRLERIEEAIEAFGDLLERFPDYTAAYYHYAGAFLRAGREEEALQTYRRGIEVAKANGDAHAREELEAAMKEIADE